MSTEELDLTIRNTDDEKIGKIVVITDPGGKRYRDFASISIKNQSLGKWDLIAVIYQGHKQTKIAVSRIEFIDCRHERGQDKPSQFFRDLKVFNPSLTIKELKFGRQQNTSSPLLFRFFADIIGEDHVFCASDGDIDRRNLTILDLSENELDIVDLNRVKRLLPWAPKLLCLNLKSCSLDDGHVAKIIEIIDASFITQMYLAGNKISKPNLELIAASLQKASERRLADGYVNGAKVENDFALGALYEKIEFSRDKFIDVPVRGGTLDLSNVVFEADPSDDDEKLFQAFFDKLAVCNPVKIVLRNSNLKTYNFSKLFAFGNERNGMIGSNSVEEMEMVNFLYRDKFDGSHMDNVGNLASLITQKFPNLKILTADNNYFVGRVRDNGRYEGGDFSRLIANGKLEQLSLANCEISDNDIFCYKPYYSDKDHEPHLTFYPAGKNLLSLNLSNNPLTDECVPEFLEWVRNSNIISINLTGTKISLHHIKQFNEITASNARHTNSFEAETLKEPAGTTVQRQEGFASKEIKPISNGPDALRRRLSEKSGVRVVG